MAKSKIQHWIEAMRPRTLPLSLSSIILGSFMAYADQQFNWSVAILAILTTVLLQILSNLANDYGDFKNGADNLERIGPSRAVQSGRISEQQMRRAIIITALLSLISGVALISSGTKGMLNQEGIIFLLLGLLAIGAAIKYTAGKNPYGYLGLGDISVFLFFGVVGVLGTYFLHTGILDWSLLLPAASIGCLSTAVLNLNNLRDHENDAKVGKNTVVVKMGYTNGKIYHAFLLATAMVCALLFVIMHYKSGFQFLFLIVLPILILNLTTVFKTEIAQNLDPELKKIALGTFFFSILYGMGQIL